MEISALAKNKQIVELEQKTRTLENELGTSRGMIAKQQQTVEDSEYTVKLVKQEKLKLYVKLENINM
jgi:DNA-directed RNA polymerase subunit L